MIDKAHCICLWSGPRNVSTALLYSFAQRDDFEVLDEPLYGHYLRVTGAQHPGRESVLAAMETDAQRVVADKLLVDPARCYRFIKSMAHHLAGLDRAFLAQMTNVLLIRDPREVLPTLAVQLPQPRLRDTGYAVQVELLRGALDRGETPRVLDARLLLQDPPGVLRRLCEALGIAYDEGMTRWSAGPKPYDGVWAGHWYHNVHRSTGFKPYRPKTEPMPAELEPLLARCRPLYEELFEHAIH